MVKRLALLFDKTGWKLPFRVFLATFTLFLVAWFDFSLLSIILAGAVFLGIYFSEGSEGKSLKISFWFLVGTGLLGLKLLLAISPLFFGVGGLIFFAVLFFGLLGLIRFIFLDRFLVYGIFNTALLFLLFLIFFHFRGPANFWLFGSLLFLAVVLIFQEVFEYFSVYEGRRSLVLAGISGLLAVEFAWILSFLPLGFINAALFLTLIFILLRDGLLVAAQGRLDLRFILREFSFFVFLGLVILAVSRWSL